MKLEGYKAGIYTKVENYRAFILSKINYSWSWEDAQINNLLAEASRELGELNVYSLLLPNVDTYINMHKKIEANKSVKIDGINISVEDCLQDIKDIEEEKKSDARKVQYCIQAMEYGIKQISLRCSTRY